MIKIFKGKIKGLLSIERMPDASNQLPAAILYD